MSSLAGTWDSWLRGTSPRSRCSDHGHPIGAAGFCGGPGRTLLSALPRIMTEWVGVAPYAAWDLPAVVYVLYPMLLLYTMLSEPVGYDLTLQRRIHWVPSSRAGAGTIIVLVILQFNPVGSPLIVGSRAATLSPCHHSCCCVWFPSSPLSVDQQRPLRSPRPSPWASLLPPLLSPTTLPAAVPCMSDSACATCRDFRTGIRPGARCFPSEALTLSHRISSPSATTSPRYACGPRNNAMAPAAGLQISLAGEFSHEVLAVGTFNRATIPNDGWLHMTFSPIRNSKKERFSISLRPVDHLLGQAIGVASSRTDEYFEGQARRDGEDLDGDLLFQYGCRVGLAGLLPQATSHTRGMTS